MLDRILLQAPVYLLVFVRVFAMLLTLPLFSMRSVSRIAKVALAFFMASFLFRTVDYTEYYPFITEDGAFSLFYVLLLVGEGLIGVLIGFIITMIFATFSSAGQFIAFQMGFGAASAYDALSQVENPLMGQFFNLVAMLVFMQDRWFQQLFLHVLTNSYRAMNAISLISNRDGFLVFVLQGLGKLFANALIISLPIMGTLCLITVCTGLLTKAAPQMNLLSEGFPVMILVAFYVIRTMIPALTNFFINVFSLGFGEIQQFFTKITGGL